MKTRTVYAIGAIAISAIALAQSVKFLQTPNGKMKVSYSSFALSKVDESSYKMVFKGSPVRAQWGEPVTTVECADFSGIAKLKGKKDLQIDTAEMKGGVVLVTSAQSSVKGSETMQTVNLKGSSAQYSAATNTVNLQGQVVIDNEDRPANRTLNMTGSSAVVVLYATDNDKGKGVRTALLKGPVRFTVNGVRSVKNEKTGKSDLVPVVITGKADSLDYDAGERRMRLAGNVSINSDDPLLSGAMDHLDDGTIWFDEKFDPIRVEMNGNEGTSTIQPKKGAKG